MARPHEQMDDWYNALFSTIATAFTEDQRGALSRTQASWVVLNVRLGRAFIDIIGPKTQLQAIEDKLTELGRDPIVIGVFRSDGTMLNAPNSAEWLKVARDVVTYDDQGVELTRTRPTAYVNVHQWAGWAEKMVI